MRQKELAEILMIHPSSLSEAIDKLEADRYLERNVDPADRRATLITLTEKGKARAYEVEDERAEALSGFFANLSYEEKRQLLSLLDKVLTDEEPAGEEE
jgi:DNA-binding MarR family transcriptional regulator